MKFHITGVLLLPILGLAIRYSWEQKHSDAETIFSLRRIGFRVLLPIVALGTALYIFLESYAAPRSYTDADLLEVLFLPLIAIEEAPMDRYNLFSLYHIWDYLNMFFLWSMPAVILYVASKWNHKKEGQQPSPLFLMFGLGLVVYVLFFFAMNPLLSMPNDWDLFSLPAIPFLFLVLIGVARYQEQALAKQTVGTVIGFSLFGLIIFGVNANQETLSHRLHEQGVWEYTTYWKGSSTSILEGIAMDANFKIHGTRLQETIDRLRPIAVEGKDIEFAALLHEKGMVHSKNGEFATALTYFEDSKHYSAQLCRNNFHLLETYFILGKYDDAFALSSSVLECQFPNSVQAHLIAINAALEANQVNAALNFTTAYLKTDPQNEMMNTIYSTIVNGGDARALFANTSTQQLPNQSKFNQQTQALLLMGGLTASERDSLVQILSNASDEMVLQNKEHFGMMHQKVGEYHFNLKEYRQALPIFQNAASLLEEKCQSYYYLFLTHFLIEEHGIADTYGEFIISCEAPNPKKSFKMAMHNAIEANQLESVQKYVQQYLAIWPEDPFVLALKKALEEGKTQEVLRSFFKQE